MLDAAFSSIGKIKTNQIEWTEEVTTLTNLIRQTNLSSKSRYE